MHLWISMTFAHVKNDSIRFDELKVSLSVVLYLYSIKKLKIRTVEGFV